MSKDAKESAGKLNREERLAAKLRENLRRRKTQTKALSKAVDGPDGETEDQAAADDA